MVFFTSGPLPVTLSVSVSLSVSADPWDMLNNFCFHVYAQKLLFMGENVNGFFDLLTLPCEWTNHRAGSQLKIIPSVLFLC